MLQKLEGVKSTLWTGLLVTVTFVATLYFQPLWLNKLPFIEYLLFGLFAVGIVFTAQFNRSRYTILMLCIMLYYLLEQGVITANIAYIYQDNLLILSGLNVLVYLTLVKDRSLFSIHGVYRLLGLMACFVAAKLWLLALGFIAPYGEANEIAQYLLAKVKLEIPLFLVAFYIFYKSLRSPNLFITSLLTSLILVFLKIQQQLALPLTLFLTLLLLHYIVVVVIDSYYLAYRDELTTIPSRRALNQYSLSLGRNYAVAMLDIDHFKKFNDNYGHDIGDQVLKLVAAKMAKVKDGGQVFRYGGEEFTVIFPRKSAEEAYQELDRVRQTIADYKIVIRHPIRKSKKARSNKSSDNFKSVSVTISIGVATRESGQKFEQVVKQADLALYRAKKKGRNNVSY